MPAMERLANIPRVILLPVYLIALPLLLIAAFAVYQQNPPADVLERLVNAVGTSAAKNNTSSATASSLLPPINGPLHIINTDRVNSTRVLLDGLLVTGFDEESCISRYESHLYRKPSPHKPSKHLIAKLRSYESLHRRCGPGTEPYNRTITKLAEFKDPIKYFSDNPTSESETECKYIIWISVNGLGNRMISLVSTFLYATLTNRVLLVQFKDAMSGLFCQPFLNSTWETPTTNFSWQRPEIPTFKHKWWNTPSTPSAHSTTNNTVPPIMFLNLLSIMKDQMKSFTCDETHFHLKKVPTLVLMSDQYFVPSLFTIPSFQQELDLMFPQKQTVFHHLGRYLFHPANPAWGLITRFYQAYLSKADEKIGLQIRLFFPNRTPIQTVMDQLLACTLSNHILPEINTQKEVMPQATANQTTTTKAIFVASLYPDFSDKLRAMYWTKPTKTGEFVEVFQATHERVQRSSNSAHQVIVLTEMYLLSLCDVLVTSGESTFGYIAQGLAGLKPWVMPKTIGHKFADPPCVRGLSMDPCFQFPPAYDCKRKVKVEHMSEVFGQSMRRCKDWGRGINMVGHDDDDLVR